MSSHCDDAPLPSGPGGGASRAGVAQLADAPVSETGRWGFESLRPHLSARRACAPQRARAAGSFLRTPRRRFTPPLRRATRRLWLPRKLRRRPCALERRPGNRNAAVSHICLRSSGDRAPGFEPGRRRFESSRRLSHHPTPWPSGEARACKARTRRFESVRCLSAVATRRDASPAASSRARELPRARAERRCLWSAARIEGGEIVTSSADVVRPRGRTSTGRFGCRRAADSYLEGSPGWACLTALASTSAGS